MEQKIITIAKACHQANKAWCEANNDFSQKDWEEAEEWQRESAVKGVMFRLENPDAGHDAQHNAWMAEKLEQGWIYGPEKNAETKTHPCLVKFEELPLFQQQKDALFCAIVDALTLKQNLPSTEPLDNNSIGARRTRTTFNPGNNDVVQNLKEHFSHTLNRIEKLKSMEVMPNDVGEHARCVSLAMTAAEESCMWSVKAATFPKQ